MDNQPSVNAIGTQVLVETKQYIVKIIEEIKLVAHLNY